MNDLKPFKHGEEGTHSVCNKHNIGGKSVCCECSEEVGCGDITMTYTQKILEEFDEKFGYLLDMADVRVHLGNPEKTEIAFKEVLKIFLATKIHQAVAEERKGMAVTENTSDGYHTFKELYEFRKIYNAVLFNEWTSGGKYQIHKSKKHSDGEECFGGGWFIVMATLPTGQISNHYELKDWDLFECEERELADKWDGHTSQDVLTRLSSLDTPLTDKE